MNERRHLLVRGHVQGVGFRWFVRERARTMGISGWVRNRPDGSVEVVAEGPVEAMERFRSVLATGPDGARVTSIDEIPLAQGELPQSDPPGEAGFFIHR